MPLTFAALRTEITQGPLKDQLAPFYPPNTPDDAQVAFLLNQVNQVGPIPIESVCAYSFAAGIVGAIQIGKATPIGTVIPTSPTNAPVTQSATTLKTFYTVDYLLSSGKFTELDIQQLDPSSGSTLFAELMGFLITVGAATSQDQTNLTAMAQNQASRSGIIFGQDVQISDVANARVGNTP